MCDGCSCPLHFSLPAETSPLEYSVYKPCLVLFGLVDHFQGRLKVKQSSSTHTHTHTRTHAHTNTYVLPLGASHVVLSACVLQKKLETSGEGLPEALLDYIRQNTSCLSSVCDKVGVLCGCSSVSCELHTTVGQHCVCVCMLTNGCLSFMLHLLSHNTTRYCHCIRRSCSQLSRLTKWWMYWVCPPCTDTAVPLKPI